MIEAAYGNACAKRQMRLPSFKETHLRETGLCASLSIRSDLRDGTDDAGEGCYQEIVAGIFSKFDQRILRIEKAVVDTGDAGFMDARPTLSRSDSNSPEFAGRALDFDADTHMKTCPDCNGNGVVDKDTDDERQCRRAVALVL